MADFEPRDIAPIFDSSRGHFSIENGSVRVNLLFPSTHFFHLRSQSALQVLQLIQKQFGGSVVTTDDKVSWQAIGEDSRKLLEILKDASILKRPQVICCLDYLNEEKRETEMPDLHPSYMAGLFESSRGSIVITDGKVCISLRFPDTPPDPSSFAAPTPRKLLEQVKKQYGGSVVTSAGNVIWMAIGDKARPLLEAMQGVSFTTQQRALIKDCLTILNK